MATRYAVLVQLKSAGDSLFGSLTTTEKKRVGHVIKSEDGGATWEYVHIEDENNIRKIATAMNQIEADRECAQFRNELES